MFYNFSFFYWKTIALKNSLRGSKTLLLSGGFLFAWRVMRFLCLSWCMKWVNYIDVSSRGQEWTSRVSGHLILFVRDRTCSCAPGPSRLPNQAVSFVARNEDFGRKTRAGSSGPNAVTVGRSGPKWSPTVPTFPGQHSTVLAGVRDRRRTESCGGRSDLAFSRTVARRKSEFRTMQKI